MNRVLLLIILVPSLILFSCQPAPAQRKLLILGSSTASCKIGETEVNCFVNRLQRYYNDKGFPVQIANRAVPGEDVYRGMPTTYVPPAGRRTPLPGFNITDGLREETPDVVLISYPSNGYDVFSVQEVMFCLRTIKQTANAAGKPCYITTSQPRYDTVSFYKSSVKKVLAEIKDSVLAEFGSYAINFWNVLVNPADTTILPQYNVDVDGTHPNDAGHALLFQQVINANIFNVTLPLRLVDFSSTPSSTGAKIEWTVEAAEEIRSYQLEKSGDGRTFSRIYEVAALNTSKAHSYSFNDRANSVNRVFYRLGIVGKDNSLTYARTIELKGSGADASEKVYLSNSSTLVARLISGTGKQVKLGIFDATGQLLRETTRNLATGTNNLMISISGLKTGLYYLRVFGEGVDGKARAFSKP